MNEFIVQLERLLIHATAYAADADEDAVLGVLSGCREVLRDIETGPWLGQAQLVAYTGGQTVRDLRSVVSDAEAAVDVAFQWLEENATSHGLVGHREFEYVSLLEDAVELVDRAMGAGFKRTPITQQFIDSALEEIGL